MRMPRPGPPASWQHHLLAGKTGCGRTKPSALVSLRAALLAACACDAQVIVLVRLAVRGRDEENARMSAQGVPSAQVGACRRRPQRRHRNVHTAWHRIQTRGADAAAREQKKLRSAARGCRTLGCGTAPPCWRTAPPARAAGSCDPCAPAGRACLLLARRLPRQAMRLQAGVRRAPWCRHGRAAAERPRAGTVTGGAARC